jgi:hypothetical protein
MSTERAKGILMFRHGVNSHQAFALLIHRAHLLETDVGAMSQRLVDDALRDGLVPHPGATQVRWMAAVAEGYRAVLNDPGPDRSLDKVFDTVLDVAVRTAEAEFGLIATSRPDRPQTMRVQTTNGYPGRRGRTTLPLREPWKSVTATGAPMTWSGRLDPAEVSATVTAVVAPFTGPAGESGALLVARPQSARSSWPPPDLPPLLTAYARQISLGVAERSIPGRGVTA